jgi:hypothetical protein
MKKTTFYFLSFISIALFSSCDETESVVYNPGDGSLDVLVSFASTITSLPITVDATGSIEVIVNASALATTDRTVDLVQGAPTSTPAIAGSFTLPTSVTIPANSYTGTFTINGTDVAGVDTSTRTFVVEFADSAIFSEGSSLTVNAFQICPVPPTFMVGNYQLQNLTQVFNGRPNFRAGIFTITAPSETERVLSTSLLGTAATPGNTIPVTLNLVCNELLLSETGPSPTLSCQAGGAAPFIRYGRATTPGTYDINGGDATFLVTFDFDVTASCGNPRPDQTFLLIKQ